MTNGKRLLTHVSSKSSGGNGLPSEITTKSGDLAAISRSTSSVSGSFSGETKARQARFRSGYGVGRNQTSIPRSTKSRALGWGGVHPTMLAEATKPSAARSRAVRDQSSSAALQGVLFVLETKRRRFKLMMSAAVAPASVVYGATTDQVMHGLASGPSP